MRRVAIFTETVTYRVVFDVLDEASEDEIEEAAWAEWEKNPNRKPTDYECECSVESR